MGTSFAERRKVLVRMLELLIEQADVLCEVICRDAGKTLHNAEKLRWTIRHGETYLRSETVSSGLLVHKRARIEYVPLGVIGVQRVFAVVGRERRDLAEPLAGSVQGMLARMG